VVEQQVGHRQHGKDCWAVNTEKYYIISYLDGVQGV
jgi:hypothetical protein